MSPSSLKEFVLDGRNMTSIDAFYDEVQRVLCPHFNHFGRNWHAFNDILRGGFLTFELGEPIILKLQYKKSIKKHLGAGYLKKIVDTIEKHSHITLELF